MGSHNIEFVLDVWTPRDMLRQLAWFITGHLSSINKALCELMGLCKVRSLWGKNMLKLNPFLVDEQCKNVLIFTVIYV